MNCFFLRPTSNPCCASPPATRQPDGQLPLSVSCSASYRSRFARWRANSRGPCLAYRNATGCCRLTNAQKRPVDSEHCSQPIGTPGSPDRYPGPLGRRNCRRPGLGHIRPSVSAPGIPHCEVGLGVQLHRGVAGYLRRKQSVGTVARSAMGPPGLRRVRPQARAPSGRVLGAQN